MDVDSHVSEKVRTRMQPLEHLIYASVAAQKFEAFLEQLARKPDAVFVHWRLATNGWFA